MEELWRGRIFSKIFGEFLHRKWKVWKHVDLANSKCCLELRTLLQLPIFTKDFFLFKIVKEIHFWFKGWTMVFKAVSGVDKKVYPTYVSPRTSSEKNMAALDVTNKHKDHYKNRIVLKWSDFGASKVIWIWKGKVKMNHYFQTKGNSRKMRSSCHERGIKKKTPSPYQESNFKSSDSALYRENIWPFFVSLWRQDGKDIFL